MFKVTDKQKDNMPSTNLFVWFIPVFFILALTTRTHVELKDGGITLSDNSHYHTAGSQGVDLLHDIAELF